MSKVKYIRDINNVEQLSAEARKALEPVSDKFKFRANDYYMGLIDWDDPDDPIRKIVIPEMFLSGTQPLILDLQLFMQVVPFRVVRFD